MKVLFMTNVPSPYRVDFFNELGKFCDLTVLFEKCTSDERDSSWQNYKFDTFKGIFLNGFSVRTDAALSFGAIKYVKDPSFDKIICANLSSPTGMIAVQYMKLKKIPYYLECDGAVAKSGKGLKERIKKHFISGAEGYYSTAAASDGYYVTYGAPPEKLLRYPFTSLRDCDVLKCPPSREEKKFIREELGMLEEKIIISVGRFSYMGGYGKGFDTVIKNAKSLSETGIYLVGDEPTEEFIKMRDEYGAKNVHFVSHKDKDDLRKYYKAADIFVLMTRGEAWGLVVNEAMSCGLPVITTDKCVAGTELIDCGENGYVVPAEDGEAYSECARRLLDDSSLCEKMGRNALEKIRKYTIEEMVRVHIAHMSK